MGTFYSASFCDSVAEVALLFYFCHQCVFHFVTVKQNKDIDKITADIRDIQKTINLNSSTLQRADAVTEELIFAVGTLYTCQFV